MMHESTFFRKWGSVVAGRFTRWVTLIVWIAVAALLSVFAPSVNKVETNNAASLPASAPSVQAAKQMKLDFSSANGQPALVVWYRQGGLTTADVTAIQGFTHALSQNPVSEQKSVLPLYQMPVQAVKQLESKDGTTLVVPVTFQENADPNVLVKSVAAIDKQIEKSSGQGTLGKLDTPGLHARITGPVGIAVDAQGLFKNADVTLLAATAMLVLILLILLYRSPILAFVPLIAVGFAYAVVSPLLGLLAKSGVIVVDAQGVSIMTVLLFGAGTDYCLFLVARYRELLSEERDKYRAIQGALSGAAGAIAMSGLTVVLSLFTLLFANYGPDHRFAVPFSLAILIMGLAGITLVPALLAIFGRVSFFPFIPRTKEMWRERDEKKGRTSKRHRTGEPGAFSRSVARIVSRRPIPIVVVSVLALAVLAGFSTQIKPTYDLLSSFPKTMQSREGYNLLASHYSKGALAPVQVVVQSNVNPVTIEKKLSALSFVESVSQPQSSKVTANVSLYNVTLRDDPYSLTAMNEIPTIRQAVNKAIGSEAGTTSTSVAASDTSARVWIGGETATQYDTQHYTNRDTKTVIPIVIVIIALLLLLYLRSVIAMVYLMLTVLLSYFSALGLGWLLLHDVMKTPAISGQIPLYAFVFLVALGEDYNIFMVSRIWQSKDEMALPDAIYEGVSKTSSVITSAGLILAGTFAVLASLPLQILVQFGIVTAIGVLLDTFIVRPLLVPSITSLLGRAAFWPSRARAKH